MEAEIMLKPNKTFDEKLDDYVKMFEKDLKKLGIKQELIEDLKIKEAIKR